MKAVSWSLCLLLLWAIALAGEPTAADFEWRRAMEESERIGQGRTAGTQVEQQTPAPGQQIRVMAVISETPVDAARRKADESARVERASHWKTAQGYSFAWQDMSVEDMDREAARLLKREQDRLEEERLLSNRRYNQKRQLEDAQRQEELNQIERKLAQSEAVLEAQWREIEEKAQVSQARSKKQRYFATAGLLFVAWIPLCISLFRHALQVPVICALCILSSCVIVINAVVPGVLIALHLPLLLCWVASLVLSLWRQPDRLAATFNPHLFSHKSP